MPLPTPNFALRARASRGFALLITIVLVAFLVLILVGLASFTRVETQVATNSRDLATARQNALLGLNIALGQLQRHAGPDQRVTARADLVAGRANPLYTGVWNTTTPGNLDPEAPAVWLVSGNEDPANSLAVNPATDLASDPDTVTLVGAAAAGPENTSGDSNHVRVRRQIITANIVPGITGPQTVGAYAYWVGDEGVKARLNLHAPGLASNATDEQGAFAFASAPRSGVELIERGPAPAPGAVTAAWGEALFPYSTVTIDGLLAREQIPLYASSGSEAAARDAARARIHDITTASASVLADTAAGGLKTDLARVLESSSVGPADADYLYAPQGPVGALPHQRPPTWARLRHWWQNPVSPDGGFLEPSLPDPATGIPSISPVVVWTELGFSFFYEETGLPATPYRLRVQGFPSVVLWNPYNATLRGGAYQLGIGSLLCNDQGAFRIETDDNTFVRLFTLWSLRFSNSVYDNNPIYIRFNVNVPDLLPGQALVFSPSASGTLYSNSPENIELNPGLTGNYFILNRTYDVPAGTNPPFRSIAFASYTNNGAGSRPGFGAEQQVYLRRSGIPGPGQPNVGTVPDQTYQYVNRLGMGQDNLYGPGGPIYPVPLGPDPLPRARLLSFARLGDFHPFFGQRWIANSNLLAHYHGRLGNGSAGSAADEGADPLRNAGFYSGSDPATELDTTPDDEVSVGRNFALTATGEAVRLILREPRPPEPGLVQSIAHLQHAPLGDSSLAPTYAIGNSLQDYRIQRTNTSVVGSPVVGVNHDASYLLNRALWDDYFFSTVPAGLTPTQLASPAFRLPNARLRPYAPSGALPAAAHLLAHDRVAAHLMLQGGFNINSTSEQAWRAVLAAAHGLDYDPETGAVPATPEPLDNPFSRFHRPRADSGTPWSGYRELTQAQLASLAANIVAEVRARGPFKSLADFVNRRLDSGPSGLAGPIQAAINASDLSPTAAHRINNLAPTNSDPSGTHLSASGYDRDAFRGKPGSEAAPVSSRNAFIPGHLTQADVLSRIGSAITARSDTFVIRVYGETRNPAIDPDEPTARAWAEALVQRLPAYVDDAATPPEALPAPGSDNERFGRRFAVIGFRWLSPDDL